MSQTHRHTDTQTHRQTYRQIDRQLEKKQRLSSSRPYFFRPRFHLPPKNHLKGPTNNLKVGLAETKLFSVQVTTQIKSSACLKWQRLQYSGRAHASLSRGCGVRILFVAGLFSLIILSRAPSLCSVPKMSFKEMQYC